MGEERDGAVRARVIMQDSLREEVRECQLVLASGM